MDEKDKVDQVLTRQDFLEKEKKQVENEHEAIAQYVLPRLEFMFKDNEKGNRIATKIYNGMPVNAGRLLADGLFGYLVSPNIRWLKLCMRKRKLEEYPEVKTFLQESEEQMYYALRSGFYGAIHEFFEVGCKLGTAVQTIEEDIAEEKNIYRTRDLAECYVAENQFGEVDTLHRKFKLTARVAVKKFIKEKEKLSAQLLRDSKDNPDEKHSFLHVVCPNDDRQYGKLNSQNKPFYSSYIDLDKKKILRESGYNKFPGCVWRWRKGNKGGWGFGPGHDALVDIFLLNQATKDIYEATHLSVKPPLNVPHDVERVRIAPYGINKYKEKEIKPIYIPSNLPIGLELIEKVEEIIRQHFMVEFFLLLSQMEGQKTATEVMELAGEKAAVMGAVIGNLCDEALNPIIDRVFDIEMRAGRMPDPPEMLRGEEIEVDYMGPIAQAQKKWLETQGIQQGLGLIVPIIELFPDARYVVDPDKITKKALQSVGFPQEAIRSDDEIQELREAAARIAQQKAALETAERLGKVLPAASKKIEEGSIMDKMAGAKA